MATTESPIANNAERRRSERWPLALPVVVQGTSLDATSFQENTITLSVSTHGALLAMVTTVTLGQTLLLRNPQTQQEIEGWVSRFGHPRGGLSQVGIAFVRPEQGFWSTNPPVKSSNGHAVNVADGADGNRAEEGTLVLSRVSTNQANNDANVSSEAVASLSNVASTSDIAAQPKPVSPGLLLQALEQTLKQAADQAVAASATLSLGPALNHAASALENFSQQRLRQLEERLMQQHHELMAAAREDVGAQVQAALARAEEQLKQRAREHVGEAARNAHSDFAEQLRDTSNQITTQFAEEAIASSSQHFARHVEGIQTAAGDARAQMESAAAEFAGSQTKSRREMEQALADAQQKFESLSLLLNGAFANCDSRVRAFQDDLASTKEQELNSFRERLRKVLSTLLNALE